MILYIITIIIGFVLGKAYELYMFYDNMIKYFYVLTFNLSSQR